MALSRLGEVLNLGDVEEALLSRTVGRHLYVLNRIPPQDSIGYRNFETCPENFARLANT